MLLHAAVHTPTAIATNPARCDDVWRIDEPQG